MSLHEGLPTEVRSFDGIIFRVIKWHRWEWYSLLDVCRMVGIKNAYATFRRVATDDKTLVHVDTRHGVHPQRVVSLAGVQKIVESARTGGDPSSRGRRFLAWLLAGETGDVQPVEVPDPPPVEARKELVQSQPGQRGEYSFDGAPIRIVLYGGAPWFVLVDVCSVLEIENPRNATARLEEDEKGVHTMDTLGGSQELTIVSESGLYSLILTSRKPQAKRFKRWVTGDVLPTIRRTGSYGIVDPMQVLNDPATMRGLLLGYTERVLALEADKAALAPKAEALDRISESDGSLCITDAAKTLQVPPRDLFRMLRAGGWIYQRAGCSGDVGYQCRINAGMLEHKTTTFRRTDGTERTATQVRVTPKGLAALAVELGRVPPRANGHAPELPI